MPTLERAVPTTPVILCGRSPFPLPRLSNFTHTDATSPQVFHEGLKSWSCCDTVNKPVLEFDQFMQIPVSDQISSRRKDLSAETKIGRVARLGLISSTSPRIRRQSPPRVLPI